MKSDLYREMYKFEWEQRTHLVSSVNIPIFGAVTLSTVLATILINFPYSNTKYLVVFEFVVCAALFFIIAALVLLFLSLLFVKYKKLPSPVALRAYYKKLLQWHLKKGNKEEDAQREFDENFNEQLAVASELNGSKNRFRGNCIYLSGAFLCCALIPLAIAGGLYVSAFIGKPDKVYEVRIIP